MCTRPAVGVQRDYVVLNPDLYMITNQDISLFPLDFTVNTNLVSIWRIMVQHNYIFSDKNREEVISLSVSHGMDSWRCIQLFSILLRRRVICFFPRCNAFDQHDDFVMNTILPELKENHDPSFKLFIHTPDFDPGLKIFDIQKAIINSNTAILVTSQAFVN